MTTNCPNVHGYWYPPFDTFGPKARLRLTRGNGACKVVRETPPGTHVRCASRPNLAIMNFLFQREVNFSALAYLFNAFSYVLHKDRAGSMALSTVPDQEPGHSTFEAFVLSQNVSFSQHSIWIWHRNVLATTDWKTHIFWWSNYEAVRDLRWSVHFCQNHRTRTFGCSVMVESLDIM